MAFLSDTSNREFPPVFLKLGLEFEMQAHTIERFENSFKQYPFDFTILSIHEIENKELWNQNFQHNKT